MSKKYTFVVEETDEDGEVASTKIHTFTTDSDAWSGFEGPMYNFFDFLKGVGYSFFSNAEIGVKCTLPNGEEEFMSATEW